MARKKTHEEFVEQVIDKFGDVYAFHEDYTLSGKEIKTEHKKCGYTWNVTPNNLLQYGSGECPECTGKSSRSPEEFMEYVVKITDGEFSSMGDFKGNNYDATFKHNPCGRVFSAHGQIAQKGELGCRECNGIAIHDKERVEFLLEDKYGTEYTLLSDTVKHNRDPIEVKHNVCGETFITRSTDIIHGGKECTHCKPSGSKGERKIEKYLIKMNIKHKREFSFADCRHVNPLLFDFIIFDSQNKIVSLIEFDGKQHFEPIEFFGGEEGFILGQLRDGIKNKYCKDNNIPLLRIPYWDEDRISEILDSYFDDNTIKEAS